MERQRNDTPGTERFLCGTPEACQSRAFSAKVDSGILGRMRDRRREGPGVSLSLGPLAAT